jgi:putative ABC transport system permease protein
MTVAASLVPTLVAVVLLAAVTVGAFLCAGIEKPFAPARALFRGTLQLAALGVVLGGLIEDTLWVVAGLMVMLIAATVTVCRRISATGRQVAAVVAALLLGNVTVLTIVFGVGAVEFSPRYLLAIGGIVTGNTMSIATLSGRGFRDLVRDHWEEVEGWLALGARPLESTRHLARAAAFAAIIPSIDQTKTTGLVVLPGAFVGAIFAGASPFEAGRFQIVVLASILAAGTITALILLRLVGGSGTRP